MQKFVQTQNELQKKEEKEREEEKERRRQLEEILNNMKQEDNTPPDTPIPTPSLLDEFSNLDLSRNRRRQNSEENHLSFRTTIHPARLETNNFMSSTKTFTSFLPPPLQLPRHQNPPPQSYTKDGAMSLPLELPPTQQAGRTRTEEQLSVISDLSTRFSGEKVTTDKTEQTSSVKSDSPQAKDVKEKISNFLNTLAGDEEYNTVNFPKILQELTVQAEDEIEW